VIPELISLLPLTFFLSLLIFLLFSEKMEVFLLAWHLVDDSGLRVVYFSFPGGDSAALTFL